RAAKDCVARGALGHDLEEEVLHHRVLPLVQRWPRERQPEPVAVRLWMALLAQATPAASTGGEVGIDLDATVINPLFRTGAAAHSQKDRQPSSSCCAAAATLGTGTSSIPLQEGSPCYHVIRLAEAHVRALPCTASAAEVLRHVQPFLRPINHAASGLPGCHARHAAAMLALLHTELLRRGITNQAAALLKRLKPLASASAARSCQQRGGHASLPARPSSAVHTAAEPGAQEPAAQESCAVPAAQRQMLAAVLEWMQQEPTMSAWARSERDSAEGGGGAPFPEAGRWLERLKTSVEEMADTDLGHEEGSAAAAVTAWSVLLRCRWRRWEAWRTQTIVRAQWSSARRARAVRLHVAALSTALLPREVTHPGAPASPEHILMPAPAVCVWLLLTCLGDAADVAARAALEDALRRQSPTLARPAAMGEAHFTARLCRELGAWWCGRPRGTFGSGGGRGGRDDAYLQAVHSLMDLSMVASQRQAPGAGGASAGASSVASGLLENCPAMLTALAARGGSRAEGGARRALLPQLVGLAAWGGASQAFQAMKGAVQAVRGERGWQLGSMQVELVQLVELAVAADGEAVRVAGNVGAQEATLQQVAHGMTAALEEADAATLCGYVGTVCRALQAYGARRVEHGYLGGAQQRDLAGVLRLLEAVVRASGEEVRSEVAAGLGHDVVRILEASSAGGARAGLGGSGQTLDSWIDSPQVVAAVVRLLDALTAVGRAGAVLAGAPSGAPSEAAGGSRVALLHSLGIEWAVLQVAKFAAREAGVGGGGGTAEQRSALPLLPSKTAVALLHLPTPQQVAPPAAAGLRTLLSSGSSREMENAAFSFLYRLNVRQLPVLQRSKLFQLENTLNAAHQVYQGARLKSGYDSAKCKQLLSIVQSMKHWAASSR
ncbi:hypothetical protein CYMTET_46113, partial [Cymbomonas tetramitiformis]